MSREIFKNRPLGDGTPRRENGFRVVESYKMESFRGHGIVNIYCWSPLLGSARAAQDWDLTRHILKLKGLM